MKTRVTVTLEDNNTMNMNVEGEAIGQVVIGMLRHGQICAEQELLMQAWLSNIDSPLFTAMAEKIMRLVSSQESA